VPVIDSHQHFWDLSAHDQPWPLDATYAQVCATARALTADLSEPEQRAIFSDTARRTYGLP
jgi:predicted TIM-barrel fold metal-dependent hydrolase